MSMKGCDSHIPPTGLVRGPNESENSFDGLGFAARVAMLSACRKLGNRLSVGMDRAFALIPSGVMHDIHVLGLEYHAADYVTIHESLPEVDLMSVREKIAHLQRSHGKDRQCSPIPVFMYGEEGGHMYWQLVDPRNGQPQRIDEKTGFPDPKGETVIVTFDPETV